MISIIIPVYNEEEVLLKNSAEFLALSKGAELIFVDGRSRAIAKRSARATGGF